MSCERARCVVVQPRSYLRDTSAVWGNNLGRQLAAGWGMSLRLEIYCVSNLGWVQKRCSKHWVAVRSIRSLYNRLLRWRGRVKPRAPAPALDSVGVALAASHDVARLSPEEGRKRPVRVRLACPANVTFDLRLQGRQILQDRRQVRQTRWRSSIRDRQAQRQKCQRLCLHDCSATKWIIHNIATLLAAAVIKLVKDRIPRIPRDAPITCSPTAATLATFTSNPVAGRLHSRAGADPRRT